MYSPVPNGYFAKFVNNKTQQESAQNTVSQGAKSVKEEHLSSEFTDEELMLALSQAEECAATAPNTSHRDTSQPISEGTRSLNMSDVEQESEGNDASQLGEEQSNYLDMNVAREEGTALVNGETNVELSRQAVSDEQAEESSVTSPSVETCSGTSNNTGQESSSSGMDTENIASMQWISCTVGKNAN